MVRWIFESDGGAGCLSTARARGRVAVGPRFALRFLGHFGQPLDDAAGCIGVADFILENFGNDLQKVSVVLWLEVTQVLLAEALWIEAFQKPGGRAPVFRSRLAQGL